MLQQFSVYTSEKAVGCLDVHNTGRKDGILRFPIKADKGADKEEILLFKNWDREQLAILDGTLEEHIANEPLNTHKFCFDYNTELVVTAPKEWYLVRYDVQKYSIEPKKDGKTLTTAKVELAD
jgi:hypothetical protein